MPRTAFFTLRAALACLLFVSLPSEPSPEANQKATTIKVASLEVNLYPIVQDRHHRLIRELDQNDFELTDNGVRQRVSYFSNEADAPLSLGLLIDTSLSQEKLLATEQAAAKMFLASVLQKNDQAFVMRFDVDSEVVQDFTRDAGLLNGALDRVQINETGQSLLAPPSVSPNSGGTHLYDAVYLASNELMKTRYGRKVVILVTDGQDQGSKIRLRDSLEAAEKADVIVYCVLVADPDFYEVEDLTYHGSAMMDKLSRTTGGRAIRASTNSVGPALKEIAEELHAQYRLAYSPSDWKKDGAFHEIHVRVRGHNYTVRARHGYFAPAD